MNWSIPLADKVSAKIDGKIFGPLAESASSSFRKPWFMDSRFVFEKQSLKSWTHWVANCIDPGN
jgi:hypothetical protein